MGNRYWLPGSFPCCLFCPRVWVSGRARRGASDVMQCRTAVTAQQHSSTASRLIRCSRVCKFPACGHPMQKLETTTDTARQRSGANGGITLAQVHWSVFCSVQSSTVRDHTEYKPAISFLLPDPTSPDEEPPPTTLCKYRSIFASGSIVISWGLRVNWFVRSTPSTLLRSIGCQALDAVTPGNTARVTEI